jgi:phage-related protein
MQKPIQWVGNSYRRLTGFDPEARRQAGFQLGLVQEGLNPEDWKTMPSIGMGDCEIRIHEPHEHRVLYVAKHSAIYVLHAFEKKTEKTGHRDLSLARRAYEAVQKVSKWNPANEDN